MPLDGTFDIWVLGFFTILSLIAAVYGIIRLAQKNALLDWDSANESLKWIGVVFAISDATPGLLFFGCVSSCPSSLVSEEVSPKTILAHLLLSPILWHATAGCVSSMENDVFSQPSECVQVCHVL